MTSERIDTIVIGAGPAGSRIAARLAGGGLRVVLLEKRDRIGHPVRCAEAVGPRADVERYIDLDDELISSPIHGVRIAAPGGESFEGALGEIGFTIDRELFDRRLAGLAAAAGAEIRTSHQAVGLICERGAVRGARVKALGSGKEYTLRAAVVAGADGIESHSPRWAGIRDCLRPGEVFSCAQDLVEGIDTSPRFLEFHLGSRLAPGGYAWVFPKGDGLANVGLGFNPDRGGGRRAVEFLDDFIAHVCPAGKRRRLVVGGCSVARGIRRLATDGYLTVGEAANQNNPFSGGGIINALEAADMAADTVIESLHRGGPSSAALNRYSKRWNDSVGKTNMAFYHAANIFYNLTDTELDRLIARVIRHPGVVCEKGVRPWKMIRALVAAQPGLVLRLLGSILRPSGR